MTTMLGKMSESKLDNFNVILFDDTPRSLWSSQIVNGIPKLSFSVSENNGNVGPIYDMILDLNTGGSTNINDALLKALEIAKDVKNLEEIGSKTQQMIVFLTDGEPTVGETSSYIIKENVKKANSDLNIPIYGLAFGDGADFNLVKDISDESNGFAQRIYESGNSFEQLEDFYTKISGTLKVFMPIISCGSF